VKFPEPYPDAASQVRALARPLVEPSDLQPLVERARDSRFICLGEASHGTREFYEWRNAISRELIEDGGVAWIGVEGDWPDCWRINLWVRGQADTELTARELLAGFQRWPTWMWANVETADFLEWLRAWNLEQPEASRVGFYGLDVYSLWDSLRQIIGWLEANEPSAVPAAMRAWQCFLPYREDPHEYAWSTRLVPTSCEVPVVQLLTEVRSRAVSHLQDENVFDAVQNAEVAAGAERYYRAMVRGDRQSWNVRDIHMADTIDRLAAHFGPGARGLVWEHNTHVGDARATDMAAEGLVNVGQLMRERHASEGVLLVGFAAHRGTVIAAGAWGAAEKVMPVPAAREGSHEQLLHATLGVPALLLFEEDRSGPWLADRRGHRAIGVVYAPEREAGNYVPTRMGDRYDALIWLEQVEALHPLHHEARPSEAEYETEPTGY
jgi:erythromycin esterase-like protein